MKKPAKVVFIQLTAIGDTLMCEPAVRALKKAMPETELTFVTSSGSAPVLTLHPQIDRMIIWNPRDNLLQYLVFLLRLSFRHYDLLIDFQKNPRTWVMSNIIRAKRKISFRSKYRNLGYGELLPPFDLQRYVAHEKLRLLEPVLGYLPESGTPRVFVNDNHREQAKALYRQLGYGPADLVIAVSPVSKNFYRRWIPEKSAAVLDLLQNKYGAKLFFTWGPGEKEQVQTVTAKMRTPVPSLDYQISDLKVLYAIYELADMAYGYDNGPRHVCIAAGTPYMCVFSHYYGRYWTPPGHPDYPFAEPISSRVVEGHERIEAVDEDEVLDKTEALVQRVIAAKKASSVHMHTHERMAE